MTTAPYRILVVDDDQSVLSLLTYVLRNQYAVTACLDGREALRWLQMEPFDLVITDLRLPDVTGMDILRAAQDLPDAPAVIIITGYATMDTAIQATNDGASAYLPKPLHLEHFRSTVSRALERRQLEHDLAEAAQNYRRLYQQAQQQVQELQLLFEASQLLGRPFDVPQAGLRLVHILERLIPRTRLARILLFEEEVETWAYRAPGPWLLADAPCPADCPVRASQPCRPPADSCPARRPETRSALCVPILAGAGVIGALCCESGQAGDFTEQEERLLATFAGQVAALLEGWRIARQRERLAALEERDRVARALHDGLAQRFSYLGLTLDALQDLLAAGRLDVARQDVTRLRRIVDEGQEEIRATIADLRQTATGRPLAAELTALVRQWSQEHQVRARFRCAAPGGLPGASAQADYLLGIVREALTNVARHAQATQVEVTIEQRGAECTLTIADNGVGFDPGPHPGLLSASGAGDQVGAHFGLAMLAERAALLGGRLTVISAPGQGARVVVTWPAPEQPPLQTSDGDEVCPPSES